MTSDNLYLGHPPESIERAVVLPHGHFVQMNDWLFNLHGLGPRYARVQTQDYRGLRELSYAYLDLPGTAYDLVTSNDNPLDRGTLEELVRNKPLVDRLISTFFARTDTMPTPQQLALALIRAQVENVQAGDELGEHRLVKWALTYELRAHWITTHRQLAFAKDRIDWDALSI
jgi:hypothetical protein